MNEQLIGDLFAEATRRMTGSSSREFSQKFTEVIVQESIKVMMENDYHGEWLGEKLKDHFGFEK